MKNLGLVSYFAISIALTSASSQAFAQTAQTPASAASSDNEASEIIVTGTRQTGITAAESATPIKVLNSEAIQHVGQPNLNQVLTQLIPSFTAQAFGQDQGANALAARLRGLNPNQTLVLVNGKRRHGTADIQVLSGPYQGSAAPDLDLISPVSIKRIEVLEDGAAAQYGSDAIAGVINIILRDDQEGGDASATYGHYYNTGGLTYSASAHVATKLGEQGFLDLTFMHRFQDYSQVGGLDQRAVDLNGNLLSTLTAEQKVLYPRVSGFPYSDKVNGTPRSHLTNAQLNAGYDFGSVQAYSFGGYSRRIADSYENPRYPDKIIASPVLGVAGTLTTPGEILFAPTGFNPREGIREDDFSATGGLKGELGGFRFDISTTYGSDKVDLYGLDSANRALFVDTHTTPTTLYDGFLKSTEWTSNADFSRKIDIGLAEPLNVAAGAEYRRQSYEIGQGDFASTYKEGGQAYPGFQASDAGRHTRSNEALYLDIAVSPVNSLKLDGAVRYEHYSDFGSEVTYKANGRYDFSPSVAVRGTVASGFRAPTLAEEFYSATNVAPTYAIVQLPANSAAAKLLGFNALKPEKSISYSAGLVLRPASRLTITADAYQIRITNRILGTGTIYGAGGALNFPVVTSAIQANGNVLDPGVSQTGISLFTNGATTRTRGVDITASYHTGLGELGDIDWTLAGDYNSTKVTKVASAPSSLIPLGSTTPIPLFDRTSTSDLESASPRVKVVASAFYTLDKFSATIRETIYGRTLVYYSPDGGTFYANKVGTTGVTDVELNFKLTSFLTISAGANNLFNKRPPSVVVIPNGSGGYVNTHSGYALDEPNSISPYGINGGFYYTRLNVKF